MSVKAIIAAALVALILIGVIILQIKNRRKN